MRRWGVACGPMIIRAHAKLRMLCRTFFAMLKHWCCWKYQYNKQMFNCIVHSHWYFCEWLCRYGGISAQTAGNIDHAYFPLKISCRGVICVFSGYYWFLFDGNKDNYTISLICVQNGCVGWWALVNLLFLS
jgi:hypothetical protein